MYTAAKITGQPAPGYSSGQAIAAMQAGRRRGAPRGVRLRVDRHDLPGAEDRQPWRPTSSPCRSSASSCSWRPSTRAGSGPLVIILTVPLAMFGAMVGLWLYDMPLDVFGQIGLVMLIGLETKNAILIVEFGVELMEKHGMSIIDSAKEASRAAAPADPDDLVRLRHGRPADGPGHRRRGLQPQLAGHRDRLRDRGQHDPRAGSSSRSIMSWASGCAPAGPGRLRPRRPRRPTGTGTPSPPSPTSSSPPRWGR